MKKISKVKFMDNGCIRFSINSVKFEDEVDCHLLVYEMCERLTTKLKRIIKPEDLTIHQYCVNNGEFEDWHGWYDCLAYVFEPILAIEYDPICGIIYIDTD